MELNTRPTSNEVIRPTIVLIEDDLLICKIVAETLESAGYKLEMTPDGAEAMDLIWQTQPALAILDCALPGRPGMVLLEELRASPMFRDLPIVMLTGRRSDWHESIALEKGASAYVRKPFETRELLIKIARLLRTDHRPSVVFDAALI